MYNILSISHVIIHLCPNFDSGLRNPHAQCPMWFSTASDTTLQYICRYIACYSKKWWHQAMTNHNGPLTRYLNLRVARVPGMPGTFFRHRLHWKPLVSNPGMRHTRSVMHVGIANPRWARKTIPSYLAHAQFYVSDKRPIKPFACHIRCIAHGWLWACSYSYPHPSPLIPTPVRCFHLKCYLTLMKHLPNGYLGQWKTNPVLLVPLYAFGSRIDYSA